MAEIELKVDEITNQDNTINVEMSEEEISFLKYLLKEYNPKKIVEIGISAGGNTVNLLQWKDKEAQLFSVDIAVQWYRDNTKLSGFMADELDVKDNWKIYRGYDYLDVCEEIGDGIDFIVIDTVHAMPGEFLTFLAALPKLKDGCIVVLHDIHLNMKFFKNNQFGDYNIAAYCTGLLFAGVSSSQKWSVDVEGISNIGAFVVEESTRDNIKDVFRILCSAWFRYPHNLNLKAYSEYVEQNYSVDCYNLFENCLNLQFKYFEDKHNHELQRQSESKNNNSKLKNLINKYF